MSEVILRERRGSIGIVVLNRPEQWNTFNEEFAVSLNNTLREMDKDDEIRVIIIKANGKHFSVGIALDEFGNKSNKEYREFLAKMDEHNHTLARMKKPVIAQVHGYALANGAGLVFSCDMAVAGRSAKIGTTAVNVGLICLGPAVPLMRIIGRRKTLEMVLTGRILSSDEAEKLGIFNKVVEDEKLEEETIKLAEEIASKSPLAVQTGKLGIYKMSDIPYHEAIDYMTELFASLSSTEDAREGVIAFTEKRKPHWRMK